MWRLAPLTLLATLNVASAPGTAREDEASVVLEVGLGDEVLANEYQRFGLELRLVNHSDVPVYVSPAIGQMASSLKIFARRAGSDSRPAMVYSRASRDTAHSFDDLFILLPRRRLELAMELSYGPIGRNLDRIEVWAELDCRAMSEIDERAFAAVLKAEPAVTRIRGRQR